MKPYTYLITCTILLLSACSNISSDDVMATANIIAKTVMEETRQAASPTPSVTPLPSATVTETSVPTLIPTIAQTSTQENTPTSQYPTYTAVPFIAAWKVSSIKFINNTDETVTFTLYGNEVIQVTITKEKIINVKFDTYYFEAYIGDDGPYNGTIFINNMDRYTINIDPGNIRVATP